MCVFVVLRRLFGDLGEKARLRDWDQLPAARDERRVLKGTGGKERQMNITDGSSDGALTQTSRHRCAPGFRAGDAALLDRAGARCVRRWLCHSLADTGLREDASCLTAARECQWLFTENGMAQKEKETVALASDSEGRRPPRQDEQMPME